MAIWRYPQFILRALSWRVSASIVSFFLHFLSLQLFQPEIVLPGNLLTEKHPEVSVLSLVVDRSYEQASQAKLDKRSVIKKQVGPR